jgi:hypothetical protein
MKVKRASAKEILQQHAMMRSDFTQWEGMLQDLQDYFVPNKTPILARLRQPGAKRTQKLFDSTAGDCVQRLTAAMHGNLTPSSAKWFFLKMRDKDLNDIQEVRQWLEECGNLIRQALNQSNMNSEISELYADLIVFGTAFMLEEVRPKVQGKFGGLRFKTYACGSYFIAEDADGYVDTVFREFTMTARQILQKWGEEVKEKSERVRQALDTGKGQMRFNMLHAIYPRDSYSDKPGRLAREMPYASVYVCLDDRKILHEGGYEEFPGMAPRWSKSADEEMGRGPGWIALPDVKTLNRAKELGLKSWAKEVDPPLLVRDAAVIGDVDIIPGGQTVVSCVPEGRALSTAVAPLDLKVKNDVNKFNINELVQSIRAMLYADQLILKESPQMTAEEVRARMELMQRILGPTLGRLETELLSRMIERTFAIMLREKALPMPPRAVLEAFRNNQADIDVEYEGPLARAQRNIEVEAIERSITRRTALVEAGVEDAFDNLDIDKALRLVDKIGGVPEDVMRSEEDTEGIAAARAEAREATRKQEEAERAAGTAKVSAEAAAKMGEAPPAAEMAEPGVAA